MSVALYDSIGSGYAAKRSPDPGISSSIRESLGDARTVINVGAGTGSYEPDDRIVVAVEPSAVMIAQRQAGSTPVVQASASALPFQDACFDAALAILTMHHWGDRTRGLCELKRVSRDRVVIFTWDPEYAGFWLTDYFPDILEIDKSIFPSIARLEEVLGAVRVIEIPIAHQCRDGFLGAYWRRPDYYLRPEIRSGMSTFSKIGRVDKDVKRLQSDLADGTWERLYGHLRSQDTMDLGYRLIIADVSTTVTSNEISVKL